MADNNSNKGKDQIAAQLRVVKDELDKFGNNAARGLIKLAPFGVQALTSACAFTMGLGTAQVVGYCLKISCATPVLGPTFGALGVGFASALAGQASRTTNKIFLTGKLELPEFKWNQVELEEVALDAVMGMFCYRIMAGPFKNIMPSNLAHPGALAAGCVPAKGDDYASASVKRELYRMFKRDGCHHCGTRKGQVIGDHMPPNKVVWKDPQPESILPPFLAENPLVLKVASALNIGLEKPRPTQNFYAQCTNCSQKQSAAMRNNRKVLVLHSLGIRGAKVAGALVGLRHYSQPTTWPKTGKDGRRRLHVPFINWSFDLSSAGEQAQARISDPSSSVWDPNVAANSGFGSYGSAQQPGNVYLTIGPAAKAGGRGMLIQTEPRGGLLGAGPNV